MPCLTEIGASRFPAQTTRPRWWRGVRTRSAAAFLMPGSGVFDALRSLDKGLPSRQEQTIFDVASGGHTDAELRSPARSQRIAYKDIAMLAHHFGVSYQAAVYRLKSLRHISHPDSHELLEQEGFGREYLKALMFRDIGVPEDPRYRDRELRSKIAHLAIEAYRREEISRGRVLELSRDPLHQRRHSATSGPSGAGRDRPRGFRDRVRDSRMTTARKKRLIEAVEDYLSGLRRIRASGGATGERSSYGPLAELLNAVGATLKPKVFCVGELADQGAGHPDFGLYTARQVQRGRPREGQVPERGVVEVKSIHQDTHADAGSRADQSLLGPLSSGVGHQPARIHAHRTGRGGTGRIA